ncbi:uncharacterized protein RJT21DRAFT_111836 [Scheffersomyces amazonensis]|uniref:uncharacterized protein n=1 Tax=Scheffersomyces amazonensis TaxID=1078765 RepID=UPI00315D6F2A
MKQREIIDVKSSLCTVPYNKYIKLIDKYLCKGIHDPFIPSLVIIYSILFLQSLQLYALFAYPIIPSASSSTNTTSLIFIDEYFLDIASNVLNLLFIVRFQFYWRFPLFIEIILFIFQNVGCYNLLFNKSLSFLIDSSTISVSNVTPLTIFLIIQIVFPYIILIINLIDYKNFSSFHHFFSDCNNNYLPIFISHSFLFINTSFPLLNIFVPTSRLSIYLLKYFASALIFAYKISSFSLKFYAIYKFILYEIVAILYNTTNIEDYSIFYKISIFNTNSGNSNNLKELHHRTINYTMVTSCTLVIFIDVIIVLAYLYYSLILA